MLRNKIKTQSKQQEHKNAGGRTMTEMLGTLAIIGVLSIGGIAGYNYAMDKYRANVTINDINLRAVDLITQAGLEADLNLAEWEQTSTAGYTFNSFGETDDGMIFLELSGIPKGVCNMVVDTLGEQFDMDINGERIDVSDECGLSDNNIITVYFEGSGAGVTCNPACGTEEICVNGICVDNEAQPLTPLCSSNEDCPECFLCREGGCFGDFYDGISCGPNDEGICKQGICLLNACSSNADCTADKYCADTNESCEIAHPNRCAKVDFSNKIINGETYYISNYFMSWWDAKNACEKLGNKTMVSVNELVIGWSGASGYYHYELTPLGETLKSIKEYVQFWTSTDSNSCDAFIVSLNNGHIWDNRYNYTALALCH